MCRACAGGGAAPRLIRATSTLPAAADATTMALVGVDGQRDKLAKLLLVRDEEGGGNKPVGVVAIVGPTGAGKTTLVHEVYRSIGPSFFDSRAWVTLSPDLGPNNAYRDILRQIEDPHGGGEDGDPESGNAMINKIKECMKRKRCLLVMDDIRNTQAWDAVRSVVPFKDTGSRVIITTRDFRIGNSCCNLWNGRDYYILPLKDSIGSHQILFERRVFGCEGACPPHLKDVARRILWASSIWPLSITVVSGLLASRPRTLSAWEDVRTAVATLTCQTTEETMKKMLLVGYDDLPRHLKACLLYLSAFPENYPINRDHAVRCWIAEGLIWGNHGRTLEEVGERYIKELLNRGMIKPARGSSYEGEPGDFIINDTVLDAMRTILFRENFVTLLVKGKLESMSYGKTRRLSIINGETGQRVPESMNVSHVRTLYIFGGGMPKLFCKDLAFLRVLDLEGCKDLTNHNIKEIAGLVHLRYLSINDTPISELPNEIGQLQYLETLDLRGTQVQELPESITKLQRLTHLLCDKMRLSGWIGRMSALSCLSQFDMLRSEVLAVDDLCNLSELTELGIWSPVVSISTEGYEQIVLSLAFSLYKLQRLQYLCIHGSESSVDLLDHMRHPLPQLQQIQVNRSCYLCRIPEWFRSLPRLAIVCIDVEEVRNEDMQLLSDLPSLLHLSLSSRSIPSEKLVIRNNGFPALRQFHLQSVRADLTFEPQAMQKLEELLLSVHIPQEAAYGFSISIEQFMCLKKIEIRIDGEAAAVSQSFGATNIATRKAAKQHPNHPTLNIMIPGSLIGNAVKDGKETEQTLEPIYDE